MPRIPRIAIPVMMENETANTVERYNGKILVVNASKSMQREIKFFAKTFGVPHIESVGLLKTDSEVRPITKAKALGAAAWLIKLL